MTDSQTYTAPPHGWTCFHCGETFTNVGLARDHFGTSAGSQAGCIEKVECGPERGLLMALRRAEHTLSVFVNDEGPVHQEMAKQQSRHAAALLTAEEAGYERGLRDGRQEISQ